MQFLNSSIKQLALATGSIAVMAAIGVAPASAAIVSYNFDINVDSGLFTEQTFSGSLSFDDASLTGTGSESVEIESLSLDFFGTVYTEADLEVTPDVEFLDGELLGLSLSSEDFESLDGVFFEINQESFYYAISSSELEGNGSIDYTFVEDGPENVASTPEPASLLALGVVGLAIARRRRA